MHRIIMNAPSRMDVDHIDHNGLNNQKSNLRICTRSENLRNSQSRLCASSEYLGVKIHRSRKMVKTKAGVKDCLSVGWIAQICLNGKPKHIKRFPYTKEGEINAALAYNEMAIKHFGEFANLNIIK